GSIAVMYSLSYAIRSIGIGYRAAISESKQALDDFLLAAKGGFRRIEDIFKATDLSKALLGEGAGSAMSKFESTMEEVRKGEVSKSKQEALAALGVTQKRALAEQKSLGREQIASDMLMLISTRFDALEKARTAAEGLGRPATAEGYRKKEVALQKLVDEAFGEEFRQAAVSHKPKEITALGEQLAAARKLGEVPGFGLEQRRANAVALEAQLKTNEALFTSLTTRIGTQMVPAV